MICQVGVVRRNMLAGSYKRLLHESLRIKNVYLDVILQPSNSKQEQGRSPNNLGILSGPLSQHLVLYLTNTGCSNKMIYYVQGLYKPTFIPVHRWFYNMLIFHSGCSLLLRYFNNVPKKAKPTGQVYLCSPISYNSVLY